MKNLKKVSEVGNRVRDDKARILAFVIERKTEHPLKFYLGTRGSFVNRVFLFTSSIGLPYPDFSADQMRT